LLVEPAIQQMDSEPKSSKFWGKAKGFSRVMIVILLMVLLIPLWAAIYFLFTGLVSAISSMLSISASLFVLQLILLTVLLCYWTVNNFFKFGFSRGTRLGCFTFLFFLIASIAALVLAGLYLPSKN
jgi:hypothetical protein